jgi:hypothetical protein
MSVKRSGKMNGLTTKIHNGASEGLILAGDLIAQRAQAKAHVVSGRWKRSITRGNPFNTISGQAISVGSNLTYAKKEEEREGTKDGTPHAALGPAIRESKRDAIKLIAKRILSKLVKL